MPTLTEQLKNCFQAAFRQALPPAFHDEDPLIRESKDKNFGDYQSNVALSLAKKMGKSPREVAALIISKLSLAGMADVSGSGFINITLCSTFLAKTLLTVKGDERFGIPKTDLAQKHMVDFSGPNLAKEMHIGHLRTTVTGEVIARILEFHGFEVERVNHVGDFGTQFGMLLQYSEENHPEVLKNPDHFQVKDLEIFYKEAKKCFDESQDFAQAARQKVVLLQSGDKQTLKIWQAFLHESLQHCHEIYELLDVNLKDVGESFYRDQLPKVVQELKDLGLAVEDHGAVCVFLEGFKNREGEPLPVIIQKSDGGYNYATTDLAAIKYRVQKCQGKRLIYVTDIRQAQHFQMIFAIARQAGWVGDQVKLEHIGYGTILGENRKPFKTREGGNVPLKKVIEEGILRSQKIMDKNLSLSKQKAKTNEIAKAVGIAAIKYFDLSHNLASDYVFNWDHMLAMDGNTGPYMLYAYARIQSIGRKSAFSWDDILKTSELILEHPSERQLALALVKMPDVLVAVARDLRPNLLTDYLFQLSKAFSVFYDKNEGVRILDAETVALKKSRLLLSALTAQVLRLGLHLLSIQVVDEM